MNTSNPIKTGERATFGECFTDTILFVKQDLTRLKHALEDVTHEPLVPFMALQKPLNSFRDVDHFRRSIGDYVKPYKKPSGRITLPDVFKKEKVPRDLTYYNTPGVHQNGPFVQTMRSFGHLPRVNSVVQELLLYSKDPAATTENILKKTYSKGTMEGFQNRLNKYMKQPIVKSIFLKEYDMTFALMQRMPFSKPLDNWEGMELFDIISTIKITPAASAGPGFWTEKRNCLQQIYHAMHDFLEHSNSETMEEFQQKHPELFILECKNKMDRYETNKLHEKCRPYFSASAPLQFLFSRIFQDATSKLELFTDNPKSFNAYGFSWANGGAKKLYNWAKGTKIGKPRVAVYGDDSVFVYRTAEGLYHFCLDFEQFDASIPNDIVYSVCAQLMTNTQDSVGGFQANVLSVFAHMATQATFIVDGTDTYTKDGSLRTGIAGTTFLGTAYAIVAFSKMIDTGVDYTNTREIIKHMSTFGLKVKNADFQILEIPQEPELGQILMDTFLGFKIRWDNGAHEPEPLPYVDLEVLETAIGSMRCTLDEEATTVRELTLSRYIFDACRGYMLTMAFHHPTIWDALASVIRKTEKHVICMRIQARNNGQVPEYAYIFPDEDSWVWPSSDGVPSPNFAKNIYLSQKNKFTPEQAPWIELFEYLNDVLRDFRKYRVTADVVKTANPQSWNAIVEEEKMLATMQPQLEFAEVTANLSKRTAVKPLIRSTKKENLNTLQSDLMNVLLRSEDVEYDTHAIEHLGIPVRNIVAQFHAAGWGITTTGTWSKNPEKCVRDYQKYVPLGTLRELDEINNIKRNIPQLPEKILKTEELQRSSEVFIFAETLPKEGRYPTSHNTFNNDVTFCYEWLQKNGKSVTNTSEVVRVENQTLVKISYVIDGCNSLGWTINSSKEKARNSFFEALAPMLLQRTNESLDKPLGAIQPVASGSGLCQSPKKVAGPSAGLPININHEVLDECRGVLSIRVNSSLDDVSYVKQLLNSNGLKAEIKTKVLSQSPNPLVSASMETRMGILGNSVDANRKAAEQRLCGELRKIMRETSP